MATRATDFLSDTLNDRFKRRFRAGFWGSPRLSTSG